MTKNCHQMATAAIPWNIPRLIAGPLRDDNTTLDWLRDQQLLPLPKYCSTHKKPMEFRSLGHGQWRCRTNSTEHTVAYTNRTIFDHAQMPFRKAVLLMYGFADQMSYDQVIRETSLDRETTSSASVADWYNCCRQVCLMALDRDYGAATDRIGGAGRIVEVDEMKLGKRKFQRGRLVEGNWILGMIDRQSGELRLEICPENRRDKNTLTGLIEKHIHPGTTLYTDMWGGYNTPHLVSKGYTHMTVNHSQTFVDPVTGVHTNKIESNWRPLRARLARTGIRTDDLADHLSGTSGNGRASEETWTRSTH